MAPAAVVVLAKVKASLATGTCQSRRSRYPRPRRCQFRVDSQENFVTVTGSVDTAAGWPPHLNVFLNPVMIDGIPEQLQMLL